MSSTRMRQAYHVMMRPMRTRALLASLLLIGCGPSEKKQEIPDAEEFPDSPIIVFPDAAPRADARPPADAKTAAPDAKPGSPDARPPVDAPPPPIDAAPTP